ATRTFTATSTPTPTSNCTPIPGAPVCIGFTTTPTPTGTLPTPTPTTFQFGGLSVFVGYVDTEHGSPTGNVGFPVPWQGSPNTSFIGSNPPYDSGAIRLENITTQAITVQSVSVYFPNHTMYDGVQTFNLWGTFSIPASTSAILTRTGGTYSFDTSDNGIPG